MTQKQDRSDTNTRNVFRSALLLAWVMLLSGCAAFSWIPGIGDDEDEEEKTEPAALVDFDAEVNVKRQWKTKVGKGLGNKYIRLQPLVVADRVVAADAYGLVAAFDRFSGEKSGSRKLVMWNVVLRGLIDFWTGVTRALSAVVLVAATVLCCWEPRAAT